VSGGKACHFQNEARALFGYVFHEATRPLDIIFMVRYFYCVRGA
jgi:hypothetical protein